LVSCNPVRKVLKDPEKFAQVKDEVIRLGYCANDTTLIVKSDTTLIIDSLIEVYTDTLNINDTIYITQWKNRNFTNTYTIHDTIKSIIVDNARVNLLQADLAAEKVKSMQWEGKANKLQGWLLILILMIGGFIYLKLRK
jgi:hypothetical protein